MSLYPGGTQAITGYKMTQHAQWNSSLYLKFAAERTQPARDLVRRIELESPTRIVDLGCGPGNSTDVLFQRWPRAEILGIDNSAEMIQAAQSNYPQRHWIVADMNSWDSSEQLSLVFSNAALQWLDHHEVHLARWMKSVESGGAVAFQIPSNNYAMVRTLIHEISHAAKWTERLDSARTSLIMHSPGFYYDILATFSRQVEIWETEYFHTLRNHSAIIEWMKGTGLRPFLNPLNVTEQTEFLAELLQQVENGYPTQFDGSVLFPFRRMFAIAYRS